jgi:hypothetical protein
MLRVRIATCFQLAQWSERCAHLCGEELRLFPRREVTALIDFVEVGQIAVGALGPASWRLIDLAGKGRYGNWNRDLRRLLVHGIEAAPGGVVVRANRAPETIALFR